MKHLASLLLLCAIIIGCAEPTHEDAPVNLSGQKWVAIFDGFLWELDFVDAETVTIQYRRGGAEKLESGKYKGAGKEITFNGIYILDYRIYANGGTESLGYDFRSAITGAESLTVKIDVEVSARDYISAIVPGIREVEFVPKGSIEEVVPKANALAGTKWRYSEGYNNRYWYLTFGEFDKAILSYIPGRDDTKNTECSGTYMVQDNIVSFNGFRMREYIYAPSYVSIQSTLHYATLNGKQMTVYVNQKVSGTDWGDLDKAFKRIE